MNLKEDLDGVGPLITDPPPTSFTILSEKNKNKTRYSSRNAPIYDE